MRLVFALLWLCAAVTAVAAQEARETRVALVIGNGAYASAGPLDNPARDAAAVARALREAGFQTVQIETDLGRDAMIRALRRFEDAADKADWALVYYAGHGIEVGGVNYLVPVDARLKSDRDVEDEAISLPQVQKRMEGARRLRLVILDACRDNPFLAKMRRTRIASRSVGQGLAVPELPQTGSLVAYSAAAGQVALDGETSAGNSPYAAALVKNLAVPDVEVNIFFRRVRAEVLRATGSKQEPATYESLPEDRYIFRPAPPAVTPAPAVPSPAPGQTAVLTPATPPSSAPDRQALIDACDRLTASATDGDRPPGVKGVAFSAIDTAAAIPACRAAVAAGEGRSARTRVGRFVGAGSGADTAEARRMLFQLGRALDAGKLYGEAKAQYERASAAGSAAAMANLGTLYANGEGGAQDYAAARGWYEKAAAAGNAGAMASLGMLYVNGDGVAQDYAAARGWFEKGAAAGNADGMASLGILYSNGLGVPQDYAAARGWYEKAAAAGSMDAMANLGTLYADGLGVAQDYAAARGWYEKAAAAGSAGGMTSLGLLYDNGLGVRQDYGTARGWYEKAAAAGDTGSMINLGILYINGRGVAQDFGAARGWYEKAAAAGNAGGMASLGLLYENGHGVARDFGTARGWYEKAAAAGDANAMKFLGVLYVNGLGVAQDYGAARGWFEKAAAAGNADAMTNLGVLYANGLGLGQDHAAARGWYEKAAAAGDARAMNNLGALYANGRGVRLDYGTARDWYEKAAAAGDVDAMYNLGGLYAGGRGVSRDYAAARSWYERAAAAGDKDAQARLDKLPR